MKKPGARQAKASSKERDFCAEAAYGDSLFARLSATARAPCPLSSAHSSCAGHERTNREGKEGWEVAKRGTSKPPAVVRVQSFARAQDVVSLCDAHGWKVIVGVEPGEPEDVSDVETLLGGGAAPSETVRREPKVGRNAPCPCGSGRKFKNCCAAR
jgi:SWIM/SEC-C metal-binding protein